MITVGKIALGENIVTVYNHLKEDGWTVETLTEKKKFSSLISAKKDKEDFLIGANSDNQISYFINSKKVNDEEFARRYIKLLEIFHDYGYFAIKKDGIEHLKKSLEPLEYINAAYSSSHNIGIIAKSKKENEEYTLSIICTSASILGYNTTSNSSYRGATSRTSHKSDDLDIWDALGIVGGITTIAGFF